MKKRNPLFRSLAIGVIAALLASSIPVFSEGKANASSFPISVWTVDALMKVFQSTVEPQNSANQIRLIAAKNERRAAQIAVRSHSALTGVSVMAGPLTGPNGSQIAAANISARFVDFIHVSTPTVGLSPDKQLVPPGGGMDYPDRITNETSRNLEANTTQPIWYSVDVPKSAQAGTYTGIVTVNTAQGTYDVDVSLQVYDVTLPDPNESAYRVDNWFTSVGWGPTAWETLERQLGVTKLSPEWWQAMDNFAKYMRLHRNNTIFIDPVALLEPVTQIDANGHYTFDWSLFDRMVQQFIDAGAMKYLEGVSLYNNRIGGRFALQTLAKVDGQTKIVYAPAQSQAADQWLNVYLPALKTHLQQKGWLNVFYQSAGDEPGDTTDRQDDNWLYDKIHALAPGIRTIEALHLTHASEFEGKLDTYVVLQSLYDAKPYYYQQRKSAGDEVWMYIASTPTGDFLTRNIDAPLAQVLLPHWYTFKNGLSGYLHWGFNYWFFRPYTIGAQSVSASSSIEADGWSKSHAVDNVTTSTATSKGWSSVSYSDPAHTEWIKLDLGAAKTVSRAMVYPYRSSVNGTVYGYPKDFTIKLSEDGSNWTTVVSEADYQVTDSSAREFNFPSHSARYVMVEATKLAADEQSKYSMQLAELQIWNDDVSREADPVPGDNWLVYPDKANHDLFSSIRAETMLEGIQDHELLELLKNSGKVDLAYNIAESLVSNGTNYNMNLDAIRLARKAVLDCLTDQTATETFVDQLNDYSNVVYKSSKLSIDSSNPVLFGGDTGRIVRLENTDQFVVYYKPNIRSFTAKLYSDSSGDIEVWGSADNNTWTPIDVTVGNRVNTAFGWFGFPVSSSAIPWGTNYLKIVIKGSNDKHWVPQIGEISITYGGDRVETPSLVANSGFESGLWEPRTNAALDTAVKYSGNQSARITAGSAANFMSSPIVKTELGKKYAFSLRLKTEAISAPDGVRVELMQVDANGNDIGIYGGNAGAFTTGGTQDWRKYTIDGIVAQAAGLRVIVRTAAGATGTVWVDDAVISAAKLPDTFTDQLDTFDGIFERSASLYIDSTNPSYFEGDKFRLTRMGANTDQYVVYNGVNISSFTATFYSDSTDNVDFYVSPDNATWTPLTVASSARVPTVSGWYKVVKSSSSLPSGTNYVKIVFRDTNTYLWAPQLSAISLTYDYANAAYPAPVSLVRNSGFELGGWPVWQGASLDTNIKRDGDVSAKLTAGTNGASIGSDAAIIDPQKQYALSLWLKTDGVTEPNGAKVGLMQVDEHGNDIGLYQGAGGSLSIGGTSDWTKHALSILGPFASGTAALKVFVRTAPGASGTVWADDIELREAGSMSQVARPTAAPDSGKVPAGTAVALQSSTVGATLHYTTDGTEPTRNSTKYTGPIEVRTAITIKAIAVKDGMADSESISKDYTIAIEQDKDAPKTQAAIEPGEPDGDNGWYTTDVSVTLNASDALSGVARTEYRLNGGEWEAYEGAIAVTAEGKNMLEYRSADRAGNIEETRSIVLPIDKTAPTILVKPDQSELWPPNGRMAPIKMTVDAADGLSGISSVALTSIVSSEPDPDGVAEADYGTNDMEFRLKAARSGSGPGRIYTITYTAVDKAGNTATGTTTVTVPHDRGRS
ncbi:glycoside hydrolase domain-containing protein [Paenibacillus sp. GCM10027626]|uniref:glycoside hydrolase domain-containing protein n=1 Tax=Paenibacillus sp. GCM10027626 TaxID=3273411 RepID=UPI00362A7FE0